MNLSVNQMLNARALILMLVFCFAASVSAQTTEFTYQGRLTNTNGAASGNYDLQFALYDSVGTQIGSLVTVTNVPVVNGIFTVALDFGDTIFAPGRSATRFLEVRVRPNGNTGAYTVLSPRQKVTSAPTAIRSLVATDAEKLGGVAASGFLLNSATQQAGANLNIGGNGTIGGNLTVGGTLSLNTVNANQQFNLVGNRVLSQPGIDNLAVGANSGAAIDTGANNTFVGKNSGQATSTGNNNSFFGFDAGKANTGGSGNTAVGSHTGAGVATGNNNTFLGFKAGTGITNLQFGTAVGANARVISSNSVMLGKFAGVYDGVSLPADVVMTAGDLQVGGDIYATNNVNVQNGLSVGGGDSVKRVLTKIITFGDFSLAAGTEGSISTFLDGTQLNDVVTIGYPVNFSPSLNCYGLVPSAGSIQLKCRNNSAAGVSLTNITIRFLVVGF